MGGEIIDLDGFSFSLPESKAPDMDSVLAFGMPKAGSTMLMKIVNDISKTLGFTVVNLPAYCFSNGVDPGKLSSSAAAVFRPKGYVYIGYRQPPHFDIPVLKASKSLLIVRDPRDCITSLYYSLAYSHGIPKVDSDYGKQRLKMREKALAQNIDDFAVEEMPVYLDKLRKFRLLRQACPGMKLMYYEENIYVKARMVKRILNHFGWRMSQDKISRIASTHDVRPSAEDHRSHIRQIHPGNYLTKLSPQTIDALNAKYGQIFRSWGYV